jgi:hypothetical protein
VAGEIVRRRQAARAAGVALADLAAALAAPPPDRSLVVALT